MAPGLTRVSLYSMLAWSFLLSFVITVLFAAENSLQKDAQGSGSSPKAPDSGISKSRENAPGFGSSAPMACESSARNGLKRSFRSSENDFSSHGSQAKASASNILVTLPDDLLRMIFKELEIWDLYATSLVSTSVYGRAHRLFFSFLSTYEFRGETYLQLTEILCDHEKLWQNARNGRGQAQARTFLAGSEKFLALSRTLKHVVGGRVKYIGQEFTKFDLHGVPLEILNSEQLISALPYILDHADAFGQYACFICGLVDRGRFDLLEQMAFTTVDSFRFAKLPSMLLPESLLIAAAKSAQKNSETSNVANMLISACDHQSIPPSSQQAPLFILRHWYMRAISIPDGFVFYDGLAESSLSLWLYVLTQGPAKAKELLNLVWKHGDPRAKLLAKLFCVPESDDELGDTSELLDSVRKDASAEKSESLDVYQAMLIRFRFSEICNLKVTRDYERMLERLDMRYHTVRALLDFGQFHLISPILSYMGEYGHSALAARMYQLMDERLSAPIRACFSGAYGAPETLKYLLKSKMRESYVQLVWEAIQSSKNHASLTTALCQLPVSVLRRFALEKNLSVKSVQEMLGTPEETLLSERAISREAYIIHVVLFWELPESVVCHLLDQSPNEMRLKFELVRDFILETWCSVELYKKLMERVEEPFDDDILDEFEEEIRDNRPGLLEEMDLE